MVTPALRALFAERQIDIIPVNSGAQMLVDELERRNSPAVQVLIGSPMNVHANGYDPLAPLVTRHIQRNAISRREPFSQGSHDRRSGGAAHRMRAGVDG